jgi:predicted ATPase
MGTTLFEPFLLSSLAFAHSKIGQSSEALHYIEEAMTVIQKGEECWYEAEVNRIAGEIALTLPEPDTAKAQEFFQRALAVARSQQAKSWELCSAMSMARLWRDQGKRLEARDLLAPIYSWFTEGLSTPVLQSASELLENLG